MFTLSDDFKDRGLPLSVLPGDFFFTFKKMDWNSFKKKKDSNQ